MTKKRSKRSTIDFDLTDKKVAIYGIPPNMLTDIKNVLKKEKGARKVEIQRLGTYENGFKLGKSKMFKDTDVVIIAKTGVSHGMSESIIAECKARNIPFAYANHPSLKRIEMSIYRSLNGYPSDEISVGDLQYPEIH